MNRPRRPYPDDYEGAQIRARQNERPPRYTGPSDRQMAEMAALLREPQPKKP